MVFAAVVAAAGLSPLAGPGAVSGVRADDDLCTHAVDGGPTLAFAAGTDSCTGARPGALVRTPMGHCTLNFVFQGADGHRYIGTAGHCILKDGQRDRVWRAGQGPWARIDGKRAGEFAYATLPWDGEALEDFALIRLDPSFPWSPSLIHFGGPTHLYTAYDEDPVVVHHTGNGLGIGNTFSHSSYGVGDKDVRPLPSRTGVARSTTYEDIVAFYSLADWGDSGSGVISADGGALATLVQLGGAGGTEIGTRLDRSVAQAEAALGTKLTLQTAPLRNVQP